MTKVCNYFSFFTILFSLLFKFAIFVGQTTETMTEEREKVLFAEIGKYCIDISKLVFGGIILAGIMDWGLNRLALLLSGVAAVTLLAVTGICFSVLSDNKKQ